MGMAKNRHGCHCCMTLKLAVYWEGIKWINWFSACCYKFRKARSYFNDFWMVVVKYGHCCWICGTVKLAVLKSEWIYELSWFFACRLVARVAKIWNWIISYSPPCWQFYRKSYLSELNFCTITNP